MNDCRLAARASWTAGANYWRAHFLAFAGIATCGQRARCSLRHRPSELGKPPEGGFPTSLAVRLAKMLIFRVTRAQRGDCHEYNRLLEDPDPSPPAWWPGRYCDPTSPARCRTPRRPSPVSWNSLIKPPKSGAWRLSSLMAGTSSAQACWPQRLPRDIAARVHFAILVQHDVVG